MRTDCSLPGTDMRVPIGGSSALSAATRRAPYRLKFGRAAGSTMPSTMSHREAQLPRLECPCGATIRRCGRQRRAHGVQTSVCTGSDCAFGPVRIW